MQTLPLKFETLNQIMKRTILSKLIIIALIAGTSLTFAQNRGQGQGQSQRRGGGGFGGISEEQREAFMKYREITRGVDEKFSTKLADARKALTETIFAKEVNEENIKAKAMAVAKIESSKAIATAKAFAKARGSMTEEQVTALKEMVTRMASFSSGRGGRGGFGGSRGGRGGSGGGNRGQGGERQRPQ